MNAWDRRPVTRNALPELIELIERLRAEQARGCPEQRPTPPDSPAVCAARRMVLAAAR